ncbi:putative hydrolase [Actinokineospora spheciospongiae]|uniref:Putative hydrolase n=1 Tax=Actinokineospora spheciospongiae TaxID=909613 RepID=W7IIZ3_9PSEU|nr:P1 family peptidase [Actinokineospora spheciospongiae]EWC60193.1 putative hydrolase [Actinokineospora spheciospongiae]
MRAGPHNALTDVPGVLLGHATRIGGGALTGTTAVLLPEGTVTAVDVRGGGPSTRDTLALDPREDRRAVAALVLTGGSSYGLGTAHGVLDWVARHRPWADPVVPTAALFDLGRGGDFTAHPRPEVGHEAASAAAGGPVAQGNVGAGTGALTAQMKGGLGTASATFPDGTTVAAVVGMNSHHPAVDPATGLPLGVAFGLPGEFPLVPVAPEVIAAGRERLRATFEARRFRAPLNTVIGVVATTAPLTPGQAHRLADAGHNGLSLAIRPSHGLADGDTIFAAATGSSGTAATALSAAPGVFARAIAHAVLAATSITTDWGELLAHRDLYPQP